MSYQGIVAVGLLTQADLDLLGPTLRGLWPVDDTPCFSGLVQAINEADRELWRARDRSNSTADVLDNVHFRDVVEIEG